MFPLSHVLKRMSKVRHVGDVGVVRVTSRFETRGRDFLVFRDSKRAMKSAVTQMMNRSIE